ncbi:cyclic pyranopterin monophosphate synthase MoaC [Deinococcus deserti]|uniref:Cyclic pyranopterin monophosphate synthase n=1 Tax=Deinococcus deserti (strain DSM 17065 / CIP 109153 / LMG 22923 / VCD115) TaxID=546414 RepID=C1CYP2_DEIDV|nr:cyclic pyranopterin monophosphate synthase MoaC [Deinococcus deserti]ACO47072.1 putative molybdenum cofactor biosynthesis protein C [Deinococcus deserti VCD115]
MSSAVPDPAEARAPELTHFSAGLPRMVDVSDKVPTARTATAEAWVRLPPEARAALEAGTNAKGDPLIVARLAGLAASKRTADLITLCHPLPVTGADVRVTLEPAGVRIEATVKTTGPTGVEMEALTAVAVAALNVYDMLKAASKALEITGIRLLTKTGGKSGDYAAAPAPLQPDVHSVDL